MDVNKTHSITPLGPGGSKQGQGRDPGEEKQDKGDGEEPAESPWEGTEAFAFDGLLADGLSPEIQKAFEELTRQIEPLRAEVERAGGREIHFKELAETHSFLPLPGRREFFRELTHVLAHMEGLTTPSLIVLHLVNADDIRRRLGRTATSHHCCLDRHFPGTENFLGQSVPLALRGNPGRNQSTLSLAYAVEVLVGANEQLSV